MRIAWTCLLVFALAGLPGCRLKGKLKPAADGGAASSEPATTAAPAGGSARKGVKVADLVYVSEGEKREAPEAESDEPTEPDDAGSPVAVIKDAGAARVSVLDAGKSTGPSDAGAAKPDGGKPKPAGNTKALLVAPKGGACPGGYVKRTGDPMCHLSCPPECPSGAKCSNLICTAAQ